MDVSEEVFGGGGVVAFSVQWLTVLVLCEYSGAIIYLDYGAIVEFSCVAIKRFMTKHKRPT